MSITINGTTGISGVDGSAGTPALQGSDPNTGIYSPGADQVAVATNGVGRLFVDASGNVSVGATQNTSKFNVLAGASNSTIMELTGASAGRGLKISTYANTANDAGVLIEAPYALYGQLAFGTAGSERLRIDSSGRLLVGTPTNIGAGADNRDTLNLVATAGGGLLLGRNDTDVVAGNNIGKIEFWGNDSNGIYELCASIVAEADGSHATGSKPTLLSFRTTAGGTSSPTEWMRINNLGLTTIYAATGGAATGPLTASTFYAGQNGSRRIIIGKHSATNVGDGTVCFYVDDRGNVLNTNNSYTAISDIKLKENIVGAKSQWDDIKALRVVNYNFKPETNFGTHTQIGLIAQEVEPVSPNLVNESPDVDENGIETGTVTKSVNYSVLYMKAVKALQEAMERIETLEAKVAALETP